MYSPLKAAAAAAGLAVTLTACGSHDSSNTDPEANGPTQRILVSRVDTYDSIQDLAKATPVIVRVRIGNDAKEVPADQTGNDPLTATVVSAEVVKAIKGEIPEAFPLRLLTSPDPKSEFPPPLQAGADYVLFLTPFEWEHGKPTGEWTVSGGAGIYKVTGPGTLERSDRGSDKLPKSIGSMGDLQSQLP